MDKCKHCGTLIESIPGRRVKEFCGNNCRAKFWQKNNPKKKEVRPLETPIKHIPPSKREIVEQVVRDFTKPTNEIKPKEQPKSNFTIDTRPKNLEELKSMCPPELTGLDKSAWVATKRQEYGI